MPPLMLPLPSAVNEPTRAKKLPVAPSAPLMENAYCPLRLALEKLPVGGGGIGVEPLLPQAAANVLASSIKKRATRFIAHRPSGPLGHFCPAPCWHLFRPEPIENRAR